MPVPVLLVWGLVLQLAERLRAACLPSILIPHRQQTRDIQVQGFPKDRQASKGLVQGCLQVAVYLQLGFWPVAIISGIEPRVSQSGHAQAEHACQKLCCYDGYQGPGNVGTDLGSHKAKEYATRSAHNEDSSNQALPVSACKPQSVVLATE